MSSRASSLCAREEAEAVALDAAIAESAAVAAEEAALDYSLLDAACAAAGFTRSAVPSDGDCFFHCLVASGCCAGATHDDLRRRLVEGMLSRVDDLLPFVAREYKVKSAALVERYKRAYVTTEIKKLLKKGVYNTDLGDIVPQYAAQAFNIRLSIYNWNWTSRTLTLFDIQELGTGTAGTAGAAAKPHVFLVRLNENHYDLLQPAAADSV
jgi:hypothetical protein